MIITEPRRPGRHAQETPPDGQPREDVACGYGNGVVEVKVFVDAWQMQCCGEPFTVCDEVS